MCVYLYKKYVLNFNKPGRESAHQSIALAFLTTQFIVMKTYFKSGNYSVEDYNDTNFAKYKVCGTNRCFDDLDEAILFAIASNYEQKNDTQIMVAVQMFLNYVQKQS